MRIFLISDNIDTLMGFRLAGVDGVVVHSEGEVREEISNIMKDGDVALIMITEYLVSLCHDFIYDLKSSGHTQIVQVPDRHGSRKPMGETIRGYLKNALGVSIS